MKPLPLHLFRISLTLIAATFGLPVQASAACPAPASGSLVICQPSANSTVYQVPHIEATANPSSGSITSLKIYIDGKQVFQNGGPGVSLFEGGVANGTHHLVINAWDDFGHLYHAQEYFAVTGNLPFSCSPGAVGVRICAPANGQVVSQNLGFSVGFKGNAPVSHVRAYVDGADVFDFAPAPGQDHVVAGGVNTTAGTHTLTVVAWDTNSSVYKSSVGIKTYYEGGCPPRATTCNPGIYPNTPNDGDDVQSPFRVSASVQYNTASITAMKVYIDGVQAGASSGPTFDQPITASAGTHIMVIQAWDTAGKLYRLTENVNVR
jgi:Bacterial Ig domain